MLRLDKCLRLLDEGFSLLTVGENKTPNFPWKKLQEKAYIKEDFEKAYNYDGSIIKADGTAIPKTNNIGIITGYDYLECIDIDLKVFSTAKEQVDFWTELLSFVKDNIFDFEDKFTVYKTQNSGYHILYKSKRCEGNKKIAKLEGHKECVIESRGNGGYVFAYENNIGKNTYQDIKFITDEDRNILWTICQSYNHIDESHKIEVSKPIQRTYDSKLTPWQDYNNKVSIFDIIDTDFTTIRSLSNKYIIKRSGAKSIHSGYVFKNSGCMYLFSTGTIYPNEKLISPFAAYAIKYHNSDYSAAAKQLYSDGYGERILKPQKEEEKQPEIVIKDIVFPIEIFPAELQSYIKQCAVTLNSSIDYMGCALLWLISVIVGNSIKIEVKKGWIEAANLWIAIVGNAGVGKTPSISNMTFPINYLNMIEIKKYVKEYEKYIKFQSLDKKEKELTEEVQKPKKSQFIVNDITLEALIEMHSENRNSVGVLKDELAGWFKEMNRYRTGSDLEHWLSSWSGKEINLNRKVAKSSFVDKAFMPVLGGIQPGVLDDFYTSENKDNGFMDRLLFSYPEIKVEEYNANEMPQEVIDRYKEYLISFYEQIKKSITYYDDLEIKSLISRLDEAAKIEWIRIFNKITASQNDEEENEYMKSMLPKQKSYIPRFALLINCINEFDTYLPNYNRVTKESILKAEMLSDYFIDHAKKIKTNSAETKDIVKTLKVNDEKTSYQKFEAIYQKNSKVNKAKLSEILGVSRRMIYKYIDDFNKK